MAEEAKCPVELKPMVQWIQEEDPRGICRSCLLGPVLQWYHEELEARGHSDKAHELEKLAQQADELPLTLCKEFDRIKGVVEEPLRERLKDFDCATQSFNADEVLEESAT